MVATTAGHPHLIDYFLEEMNPETLDLQEMVLVFAMNSH